jgi:Excalibur calcium-binding domain
MTRSKFLALLTILISTSLLGQPASATAPSITDLSKLVRHEILIPGTTYMNTGGSQIDHSTLLSDGGVAVCGFFEGTRKFGNTTITSHKVISNDPNAPYKNADPYVAKADSTGKWVWAAAVNATEGGFCRTVSQQSDGLIRVRINFEGNATFGGKRLLGAKNADLFISNAGLPLNFLETQLEPEDVVSNTNLSEYTPLEISPAFIGGTVSAWTTYWNINGTTTGVDVNGSAAGILGKKVGNSWSWVVATPGNTAIQPMWDFVPTSEGGVVAGLAKWQGSQLSFAGFTATTGVTAIAKFDNVGQPVWGFEVPNRQITAYAELSDHQFAVTQGIETAFEVSDFKLQIYKENGQLQQNLNLPRMAFPPRSIHITKQNSVWLQTTNSLILLEAPKPVQVKYKSCTTLNAKYPGGVASSAKAKNKGKAARYKPVISASLYNLNKLLDTDKDLLVCER